MYTQGKVSCFHVRTVTYRENSNTVKPPLSGHRLFNGQGPVVRTPVRANPGLNFNPGFVFLLSKALSRIIFFILFRVSNHHRLVGKENLTQFAFEALISEFKFLTNPGLP